MLSLGFSEIAVIVVLALVVVGPERLPRVMRYVGRQYGQLRRMADEMRRAMVLEADRQDAEERYEEMQRRREELKRAREEAEAAGGVSQSQPFPQPVPDTDEVDLADVPDGVAQPALIEGPAEGRAPEAQRVEAPPEEVEPVEAEVVDPEPRERSVAGE